MMDEQREGLTSHGSWWQRRQGGGMEENVSARMQRRGRSPRVNQHQVPFVRLNKPT